MSENKTELGPETSKVVYEMALQEFDRFTHAWDIDANVDAMNGEDKESFEVQKGRIVRAIQSGAATIDEEGDVTYALKHPKGAVTSLCFKAGRTSLIAMDQYKDRQNVHKMYAVIGSMVAQPPKLIANMDARDTKLCMGVASLFLGS